MPEESPNQNSNGKETKEPTAFDEQLDAMSKESPAITLKKLGLPANRIKQLERLTPDQQEALRNNMITYARTFGGITVFQKAEFDDLLNCMHSYPTSTIEEACALYAGTSFNAETDTKWLAFVIRQPTVRRAQQKRIGEKRERLAEAGLALSGTSVRELVELKPEDIEQSKLLAANNNNINTLKIARSVLETLTLLVKPGSEVVAYKALHDAHVHLEEINPTNAKPLLRFLAAYLRKERGISVKYPTVSLVTNYDSKASSEELLQYLNTVFVDKNSSRNFNAVFSGVHHHTKNIPSGTKYSEEAIESFSLINFSKDVAFTKMFSVVEYIPKKALQADPELPVIIARHLHVKGIEVSQQAVEEEIEALNQLRSTYQDVLFLGPGQEVTIISNNESFYRLKESKRPIPDAVLHNLFQEAGSADDLELVDRFGTKGLEDAIKKTGAALSTIEPRQRIVIEDNKVEIVSNEEMLKDIETKKKEAVAKIVSAPPGHFFLFDGHGGKEAFWLSDGFVGQEQIKSEKQPMLIDSKTFAEALTKRYEKYKDDPKKLQLLRQDKFLFASCFSKNLQQNIDTALGDVPYRPIIIAVSEHGQFGFSVREDDTITRSVALDTAFGLGSNRPITIGDLLKLQASAHVNIAILVPAKNKEKTILLQIAATERDEPRKNESA